MPELPEVQTIARELAAELRGACFAGVTLPFAGSVDEGKTKQHAGRDVLSRPAFLRAVPGCRLRRIWRRGKALIMDLESPAHLLLHLAFHLRMTGRLTVEAPGAAPGKHTRIIFALQDGRQLFFSDVRKFGYCRAMTPQGLARWPFFAKLGPEPLEISQAGFIDLFQGRRAGMKGLLLNQHFIAGIGNIYADESLFRAGIRPEATSDTVSKKRLKALHAALVDVLNEAIAANGSTISDYRRAGGDAGAFQNDFRVYGRGGQPCRTCNTPLIKTTVAGRATVFCEQCQH